MIDTIISHLIKIDFKLFSNEYYTMYIHLTFDAVQLKLHRKNFSTKNQRNLSIVLHRSPKFW
jgi:hypothetical protein